jgi:hypothetical protein
MTFYTDSFPPHTRLALGEAARGGFMHRSGTVIVIVVGIILAASLTGCVGKSTGGAAGGGVQSVTLTPSGDQSIDIGATQVFTATARDAKGVAILAATIQFTVTSGDSNPAPLSITSAGAGCAGSWDSTQTICSPGVPGIALVTATVGGVSSPATRVFVHQHIASIQVSPVSPPLHDCFSQGETADFQAVAFDVNQHDITNSVGPLIWSASNGTVLTVNNITGLLGNQTQVTAKTPGVTQLFASVSGTTSTPLTHPFVTCLVNEIHLQIVGDTGNSFTIASSSSKTIKATVIDTRGTTIENPPLVWISSNPEVANFSSPSNTTGSNSVTARLNPGGADVSAACTPPTCNIGVLPGLPVYSSNGQLPDGEQGFGAISANITPSPTKPPTFTAWAATTDCGTGPGCTSVTFAVTPGTTPIGAQVGVPRTPNSMMFNEQGTRIYFGSDQGLMFLDVGASTPTVTPVSAAPTPCNVSLCGKVLAISDDGNRALVSDGNPVPEQAFIFDAVANAAAPVDLVLPTGTAKAAAFSPDGLKIFIVTDAGVMFAFSTVDALRPVTVTTTAKDVAFSADGSFAYVAGTASVSGFATCNLANVLPSVTTSGAPFNIAPLPNLQLDLTGRLAQSVLALDPPNADIFTVAFEQQPPFEQPPASGQFFCKEPAVQHVETEFPDRTINLGQGNFTPLYIRVVGDGSQAIVLGDRIPAVLVVDINQQTTTPIALVNNALPRAASASSDGSQVFVAACDVFTNNDPTQCTSGSVHIINTVSGGDFQQVPFVNVNTNNSMCNLPSAPPCFPNLIAVRPQ